MLACSYPFVLANWPQRFAEAQANYADTVIIDLEDAFT
jgi:citrate lyase beta subunit